MLNQELVRAGMAWRYKQYAPDDLTLKQLQLQAMTDKRGLWADPSPVAPWDFRHGGSAAQAPAPQSLGAAATQGPAQAPGTTQAEASAVPGQAETNPDTQVYITQTGKKYHAVGCRYLSKSQIPIPLSDAQAKGYTPCSVCRPPLKAEGTGNDGQTLYPSPALSSPSYRAPPASSNQGEEQVFITATGQKYHRAGCRYLSKSQIPISLKDAKARGPSPCSVCQPPK